MKDRHAAPVTHIPDESLQNNSRTDPWFEVEGDLDDFIFYESEQWCSER